ncbi:MAG: phosphodiesterase [Bacilli bacterium]|jgi:putative phosphoesterase|nr:phosphodiesterase [Bacilli bacterium]
MRVLIGSDLHGRTLAACSFESAVGRFSPDRVIVLGDFLYNGPRNGVPDDYDGMAVAKTLKRIPHLSGVRGNCDADIDISVLGFPLPRRREETIGGHRCVLVHGDDLDPSFVNVKAGDILMYGHTHLLELERREGIVFLNPGSLGFPKGGNPASFALFDGDDLSIIDLNGFKTIKALSLMR